MQIIASKYIDTIFSAKRALQDWRTQEWKASRGADRAKEIDDDMTAIPSATGKAPVQGGGSAAEERLAALIDQKDIATIGATEAEAYFAWMLPAWEQLNADEQFLLTTRFIDYEERSGICHIMQIQHVEQREAYYRSGEALAKFAKLLYW